ncbi:tetratricopeptide (TPR) repeat protein [Saonia flava]|uniref:Tetratricopeptide (TPR) repeat protein n=1 Tax=Saonia flava TaxID=523696 RepID=A0A846R3A2_9FLAO|nr:tetratricopeptide repeat protein [Saonia flava]NJB71299.1 tetratricopeptide (TPR) repeat protein [Saonia flava]
MKHFITILALLISFWGTAQNEALFNNATTAYNEGDYDKAIENYQRILENGEHSAALYFNLGNAHYKLNQIAPSIYYYEKALLLKPNDPEIQSNLGYAQNMTLDAIEEMPETGLSKIYKKLTSFLSFDQWAYTAIVLMILFVLMYIAFYYFRYATHKRIAFITSVVSLILSVFSIVMAYLQYNDFNNYQPAIVFANETIIKSEPNNRSEEVFRLHQGTKVNVLEQLNNWKKIKILDGKIGWVPSDDIKILKDF